MGKNIIVSLSGGKDSTALLLMMLERGIPVHSAVFFDTGWEFPQMHDHLDKLESMIDVPIVRLKPERSFDYWMFERPVVGRKGKNKGQIHRIGNGWPSVMRRWCTRIKVKYIQRYLKSVPNAISAIGFAADEKKRTALKGTGDNVIPKIYPLIEWGITEADALKYCVEMGFDWGGLYKYFYRVSCFCCPLQNIKSLKTLRDNFPDLWWHMLEMDSKIKDNKGFRPPKTLLDLELKWQYAPEVK